LSDGRVTIPAAPGTLRVGDVVTFSSRPKWWRRLLLRLRLVKPKPRRFFVISWTATEMDD
jgi:hypothetical protein